MQARNSVYLMAAALFLALSPERTLAASASLTPSDRDITSALGRRFLADEEIPAELIDIKTAGGIVTLSGIADNALEKERAAEIAETLRGVRAVINEIVVEPVTRDDGLIKTEIQNALRDDPATSELPVAVSVSHGVATLTGAVFSGSARQLVENISDGVEGVKDVKNEVTIAQVPEPVSDKELAAEVKDRLDYDVWLNPALIDVEAHQGTIQLSGSVGTLYQKNRAMEYAWIEGVRSVDGSGLAVMGWPHALPGRSPSGHRNDAAIRQVIEKVFREDPRVRPFKLDVDVAGGRVTLNGFVDNLKARRAAEADAQDTSGVVGVDNDLKVRLSSPLADAALTQTVQAALRRDPYLDQDTVRVYVRHGLVYLYGGTDSLFEKEWAEEIVSRIRGVVAVRNRIVPSYRRPPMSDSEIKENIEWYWFWNPLVPGRHLQVSVRDSMATVSGTASNMAEKRDAIRDAYKAGALHVFDQVKLD